MPAATVTVDAGTAAVLELVSETAAPPLGAAPDNPTVTLMLLPPTTELPDTETEEILTVDEA